MHFYNHVEECPQALVVADEGDMAVTYGLEYGFNGFFFGFDGAVGFVKVGEVMIITGPHHWFVMFFGGGNGFFVVFVDSFAVIPAVFNGIEDVDMLFQLFMEGNWSGIVWMGRNHQALWVIFFIKTEIVECFDLLSFHIGIENENMLSLDTFFNGWN